jgi:hypothetical protein
MFSFAPTSYDTVPTGSGKKTFSDAGKTDILDQQHCWQSSQYRAAIM